jgi:hypothetical protein
MKMKKIIQRSGLVFWRAGPPIMSHREAAPTQIDSKGNVMWHLHNEPRTETSPKGGAARLKWWKKQRARRLPETS